METIIKNINSYFREPLPPCTIDEIESFEKKYKIEIPEQLRHLLLTTTGGCFDYGFRNLSLPSIEIEDENEIVRDFLYEIADLAQIANGIDDPYEVENIESILYITSSDTRSRFFIGHSGEFKDKIYWSSESPWQDGVLNAEGKFIAPLRFLANSLEEFFLMLGPVPEE